MVYAQASQFDRASVTMKMTAATHAVLLHVFCVFVCMCACVCVSMHVFACTFVCIWHLCMYYVHVLVRMYVHQFPFL